MNYFKKKFNIKIIFSLWILSFIAMLFFYINVKNYIEDNTFNLVEKITTESNKNIEDSVQNKFNFLETISQNIYDEDLSNPKKLSKSFSKIIKKNNFKSLAIITLDGTAYFNNGDIEDVSDKDYFKSAMHGNRYASSVYHSDIYGEKINDFSMPIYNNNNEISGVLLITISSEEFYESFNLGILEELGDTFIINSEGTIMAFNKNSKFNFDSLNFFERLKNKGAKFDPKDFIYNSKGYVDLSISHKDNYTLYYSKLDYYDWWEVSLINNNTLKNYYHDILQNIIIITTVIILFISTLFIIIVFNKGKRKLKDLKDMAYIDNITNGKNDTYLKNNFYNIVNEKNKFAFISLEIMNIKDITTISGLNNTKFILNEVYKYLYSILDEDEVVVHSYLGEYKLILKYDNIKDLTTRLENIEFYRINENIKFIIGVYLVENFDVLYEDICSYVTIAKEFLNNSNIKNNRNHKYIIYNKKMHKKEIDKLKLEEDIKNGIENKEFKAWFQPKYGKDGKSIIGAEALVRWHKYGSIISPYIFVPICEANGLIKEIDELVFEDVCKNIRKWINEGKNIVPVSVNLSRSYMDKVDFISNIEKYMDKYKITKDLIHFEITESSLIGNEKKLKDVVSLLHEKGFEVSVDDFGVGYSSIKTISYVEFDTLKIDKSFVDGIGEEKWESIIEYTINLAKKLGMDVVAEGIENKEQYEFLSKCNCDRFQGYYFNRPMDSKNFSRLI